MINVMNQVEKSLDSQLWHACAGGLAQIPPINSKVCYFPQGHVENAPKNVDFGGFPRISPFILCRVSCIKYLADSETDEVYAKIRLVPLRGNEFDVDDDVGLMGIEEKEKPNSFAKTLTQSDANNGGGFSVPRYCAETIFPRLDYMAEPPVQTILAKDVHGEVWKFRHIYRGTPRRHLLTTGWSNFVNQKKLVAGDSIVFLRAENGNLFVGIRRAKMGIGGGPEVSFGWNANCASSSGNWSLCNIGRGNGNCGLGVKERGNVRAESVMEAVNLAASGRPFDVVCYPRANTPEFVVRASAVRDAMRVQWCAGMRFKMAFETEDSSRISWFMGTVSSVQVNDPICWPNSPWRLLEVAWDEPELLQNVKRVNPWLVKLVSNTPTIHLSPFSPPLKRPRLSEPSELSGGQLPMMTTLLTNPLSPSSPLCCFSDNISAGIQGARHAQIAFSSSNLHFNKLQTGLQPFDFKPGPLTLSCPDQNLKKTTNTTPVFLLFGQPILTEQQISLSCSMDTGGNGLSDGNKENTGNVSNRSGSSIIQNCPRDASSDEEFPKTAQCKVFVESEDVGRTLNLTILRSCEELRGKVTAM